MRVGMLTGGGDCPGLNAVMRAVARKGEREFGYELVGFIDGWRGVIDNQTRPLSVEALRGTLPRGGTILGTSRTNPFNVDGGVDKVMETLAAQQIDALVGGQAAPLALQGGAGGADGGIDFRLAGLRHLGDHRIVQGRVLGERPSVRRSREFAVDEMLDLLHGHSCCPSRKRG